MSKLSRTVVMMLTALIFFGCQNILSIQENPPSRLSSESTPKPPLLKDEDTESVEEMENENSESQKLKYPSSKRDFSGLAPHVDFQSIDFSLPVDEHVFDSCWLDDNTLVLMTLIDGKDWRESVWDNAGNDEWKFYTAKLDTGLVEPSTSNEIQDTRNLCLSLPRMYGDYSSSQWGYPAPTFATSLYLTEGSPAYNTTSNIYNLDFTKIAKRQSYQHIENLENENYDQKSSYNIVLVDVQTGVESLLYSGFAANAMQDPLGLVLLGFSEDSRYIFYQYHSEIYNEVGLFGLLDVATGNLIPSTSEIACAKIKSFVPTLPDTVWVTNGSGPPGGYGRFDGNEIRNLITGEQRTINPIESYYEYMQIPVMDVIPYTRAFRMARETPTLICFFQDENGDHLFLYDIPTGAISPQVSSETGVFLRSYRTSLSSSQNNLAFCVELGEEESDDFSQRILIYKQSTVS